MIKFLKRLFCDHRFIVIDKFDKWFTHEYFYYKKYYTVHECNKCKKKKIEVKTDY